MALTSNKQFMQAPDKPKFIPSPGRAEQTERAYRNQIQTTLHDLLATMNPQDKIHWAGLPYPDLVSYARDWLETEVATLNPDLAQPSAKNQSGGALTLED